MKTDVLELYQSIFTYQGIQFLLFGEDLADIERIDYGMRKSIMRNYHYEEFLSIMQKLTFQNPVIFLHDRLKLDYCIILFPESWQTEYHARFLIIGPVFTHTADIHALKASLKEYGIPGKYTNDCLEFYNRIPTVYSVSMWHSLLRPFLMQLYQNEIPYQLLELSHETHTQDNFLFQSENRSSLSALEDRYYTENQLLDAISKGDSELAMDWARKFSNFKLIPRASNPIRHEKNILLVFNTLMRKTIERTKIHPFYIDRISSECAIKIELCNSIQQLESLHATMIRKYCLLIKNHSGHNYSEIVEKCMQYIDLHYMDTISVNMLASYCSVTANYLSAAFHRETGKTITDYTNETRIEHSILLLNTTKAPIQQIAGQCGFPDANYYSRTFKKYKGITPLSYRKTIQN